MRVLSVLTDDAPVTSRIFVLNYFAPSSFPSLVSLFRVLAFKFCLLSLTLISPFQVFSLFLQFVLLLLQFLLVLVFLEYLMVLLVPAVGVFLFSSSILVLFFLVMVYL